MKESLVPNSGLQPREDLPEVHCGSCARARSHTHTDRERERERDDKERPRNNRANKASEFCALPAIGTESERERESGCACAGQCRDARHAFWLGKNKDNRMGSLRSGGLSPHPTDTFRSKLRHESDSIQDLDISPCDPLSPIHASEYYFLFLLFASFVFIIMQLPSLLSFPRRLRTSPPGFNAAGL
jgi:hypothetical protein